MDDGGDRTLSYQHMLYLYSQQDVRNSTASAPSCRKCRNEKRRSPRQDIIQARLHNGLMHDVRCEANWRYWVQCGSGCRDASKRRNLAPSGRVGGFGGEHGTHDVGLGFQRAHDSPDSKFRNGNRAPDEASRRIMPNEKPVVAVFSESESVD